MSRPGSPVSLDDLPGSVLRGRYEFGRILGKGGMGAVFEAVDLSLSRPVAIKVVLPTLAAGPEARQELFARFRREARITASLKHHHIVEVLDFDEDPDFGILFLVMEHLHGTDLDRVLSKEKRLAAQRAVIILSEVCQAIGHAHRAGQIHRDLKPSNIMLIARDGNPEFVKVLDFGLARGEVEETKLTRTGQIMGTAFYMAPEQIDSQGVPITRSCDIYSLGAVAYHLLSGRPPFLGSTLLDIWKGHLFERAIPLKTVLPDIPEFLSTAIERALAKRPEGRFPSVEAFRDAMQAAFSSRTPARMAAPAESPSVAEPRKDANPTPEKPVPPGASRLSLALKKELTSQRDRILGTGPGTLHKTASGIATVFTRSLSGCPEIVCLSLGQSLHTLHQTVLPRSQGDPLFCSAASLAKDRSFLVFTLARPQDGSSPVFACVFSEASADTFAPSLLSEGAITAEAPRVAVSPSGAVVTAWHQFSGSELRTVVSWWNPDRRETSRVSIPDAAFPSIATHGEKTICAVHELTATGRVLVLYTFDTPGRPPFRTELTGLTRPAFPVLAAGSEGQAGLVFWDLAPSPSILFQRLSRDGQPRSAPIFMGAAATPPRCPALTAIPGGFAAAWAGRASAPGRFPLSVCLLPGTSSPLSPPLVLDEGEISHPSLLFVPGNLFAAWRRVSPSGSGLWAARLALEPA